MYFEGTFRISLEVGVLLLVDGFSTGGSPSRREYGFPDNVSGGGKEGQPLKKLDLTPVETKTFYSLKLVRKSEPGLENVERERLGPSPVIIYLRPLLSPPFSLPELYESLSLNDSDGNVEQARGGPERHLLSYPATISNGLEHQLQL